MNVSNRLKGETEEPDSMPPPCLNITKLGIVSRDYWCEFENGQRDFSHILPNALKLLDDKGCDAVLFSLFSIDDRKSYDPCTAFKGLKNVKAIFLEEFKDNFKGKINLKGKIKERTRGIYNVHHRPSKEWAKYSFEQVFGTLTGMRKGVIDKFIKDDMPKRIMGNCCVLLCGESNGVKYSKENKIVEDTFGLREFIQKKKTNIILNPIHDRMTRFEMKLKRQFLSEKKRWIISVWNKGKKDKNGNTKDDEKPAWMVFFNGKEVIVEPEKHSFGVNVEVGILSIPIN